MSKEISEELEGFLHDLQDGSELFFELGNNGKPGSNLFAALGFLIDELVRNYTGEFHVEVDEEEAQLVARAYTLVARANKIIRMNQLVSAEELERVGLVGKLLPLVWKMIPDYEKLEEGFPSIVKKDDPAWSQP